MEQPKGSRGDLFAKYLALFSVAAITFFTWLAVYRNDPIAAGWFAFHPTLQTLSILVFTYAILTLQPAVQPATKAASLDRHQAIIFVLGLPSIILGTAAIAYKKWLQGEDNMTSWHGTFGYLTIFWVLFQFILGGSSVWFPGNTFGGVKKASLRRYHRLSGYLLLSVILFTIHLGGSWSNWGVRSVEPGVRTIIYTIAPSLVLFSVFSRIKQDQVFLKNYTSEGDALA